ncbi:MAG: hypothetical protein AB8I08_15845 [Sandaracinaceae bacterium]
MALLGLALVLGGCGEDEPETPHVPFEPTFVPIAGGVGWIAPDPLVYRRPSNPMRSAEYIMREHPDAVLAVSYFPPNQGGGGDVRRNVSRWVGQLQRAPGDRPNIQERTINGLEVTTVDVRGTFVGRLGTGGNNPPRVGWRILGAIVEGERGLVFFKFIGPEGALAEAQDAFDELVESIHPE